MLTTFTEQQSTGNSQLIVWGIDCVNGMDQIFWYIMSHERAVVRSSNELLADLPRAVGCTEGEGHNFAYSQKRNTRSSSMEFTSESTIQDMIQQSNVNKVGSYPRI
jgi:hypothetical protein